MELRVRNVEEAFNTGIQLILSHGIEEDSRNGKVLVIREPVTTIYDYPMERVLLNVARDANPYFHVMESMWMLLGRNDLALVKRFNSKMGEYSDDGQTLHGAYGYRWKNFFNLNQLNEIMMQLRSDPLSRRCVLQMWSYTDLLVISRDKPCNTHCYFRINNGQLDMTVCCRSNDIIWGAYGANSVHFSILQEYMAAGIGVPIGRMYQFSNNYHAYVEVLKYQDRVFLPTNSYNAGHFTKTPIVTDYFYFIDELKKTMALVENPQVIGETFVWKNPFMNILLMMGISWHYYKNKNLDRAVQWAERLPCGDWRIACTEWMKRRQING